MGHCSNCNALVNSRWETCAACGVKLNSDLFTLHVKSAILGRTVKMILDPKAPDSAVFDGATYTMAEINKLKSLDRESLATAHMVKREFEGTVKP